ncbi:unnamed protein product [Mytilus coruscus]|uniref:Endonuclease/exonuclease/phosphatase domain-containing protein n=1 Tax=Mytilus coruscus TaxID=42192 RepID=A0A6J8CFU6_MYTCO|nr:unnamed protein product [Mytilus coruscus]
MLRDWVLLTTESFKWFAIVRHRSLKQNDKYWYIVCKIKIKIPTISHVNPGVHTWSTWSPAINKMPIPIPNADCCAKVFSTTSMALWAIDNGKVDYARDFLSSTVDKIKHRNKLIKIADTSEGGWDTARQNDVNPIASDYEDEANIIRADNRAVHKKKGKAKQDRGNGSKTKANNQISIRTGSKIRSAALSWASATLVQWKSPSTRFQCWKNAEGTMLLLWVLHTLPVQLSDSNLFSQETQQSQNSQASESSVADIDCLGKLNEFLQACNTSPVKKIREPLSASSERTQRRYTEKANECLSLLLETMCPGESEQLKKNMFSKLENNMTRMDSPQFIDALAKSYMRAETSTDLQLGEKTMTLSSGELIQISYVIRCLAPATIVKQYARICQEENVNTIECSAAVRKSVERVDYYIAETGEAFRELEKTVNQIPMNNDWKETIEKLLKAKHYPKTDYKAIDLQQKGKYRVRVVTPAIDADADKIHTINSITIQSDDAEQENTTEVTEERGWAFKVKKPKVLFKDDQKQLVYLSEEFNISKVTWNKEDPAKVSRDMPYVLKDGHKRFTREHFLTTSQVASYFSRLSLKDRRNNIQDQNDFAASIADKKMFDHALNAWYSKLLNVLNKHAPIITKRVKKKSQPKWLNQDINQLRARRDFYHKREISKNKLFRNKLTAQINQCKTDYFSKAVQSNSLTSEIWKHLKDLNAESKCPITSVTFQGSEVNEPKKKPPNSMISWYDFFENEIEKAYSYNNHIVLTGDFNIYFLQPLHKKWDCILSVYNIFQLVNESTRVTKNSVTLIDHIYSTNPEEITDVNVPAYCPGDHYPVSFTIKKPTFKTSVDKHVTIKYRNFTKFNKEKFIEDFKAKHFNEILYFDNPDHALNAWYSKLLNVLNKHAPIITKRVKKKSQPKWLNQDINQLRARRDFYHKKRDF